MALRAAAGIPRFGVDFEASNLPQEARVDAAINYEKGCYLGQEVVARMHYRGRPARELRRVAGGGAAPAAGSDLYAGAGESADGSRSVGRITSAVPAPDGTSWQGLAMLAKTALEAEAVALQTGGAVQILGAPASAD